MCINLPLLKMLIDEGEGSLSLAIDEKDMSLTRGERSFVPQSVNEWIQIHQSNSVLIPHSLHENLSQVQGAL